VSIGEIAVVCIEIGNWSIKMMVLEGGQGKVMERGGEEVWGGGVSG
jgi:hypothetical protein